MAKEQPIEIFMPPNILKAKVGGSGGLDLNAVRRAEQAIQQLKGDFANWIVDDVNKLAGARNEYDASRTKDTLGALYRSAHDLKGLGQTLDFPLVSRMAASLCKLTDIQGDGKEIPIALIDAHVDAIKVIVRQGIKDPANMTASLLAAELEGRVTKYQG